MKSGVRALILIATLFLTVSDARAGDSTIVLGIGTASELTLVRAFATMLADDSGVVDVHADGDRSVVIEARKVGQTNLVFIDDRGVVIANIRVSICSGPACEAELAREKPGLRSPSVNTRTREPAGGNT